MPDNLLAPPRSPSAEEITETLITLGRTRVERIVSHGHASPPGFWYDQDEDEWVAVLSGQARLRLEDPAETVELRPGDHIAIAAHRRHRVEWTLPSEPTVWLAVFAPARSPSP